MEDGEFDKLTTLTREPVDEISTSFKKKCSELQAGMMKRCGAHGDQAKRNEAQIAITYCAARQVCPVTADDFRRIGKQEKRTSAVQRHGVGRAALRPHGEPHRHAIATFGLKEAAAAAEE